MWYAWTYIVRHFMASITPYNSKKFLHVTKPLYQNCEHYSSHRAFIDLSKYMLNEATNIQCVSSSQ